MKKRFHSCRNSSLTTIRCEILFKNVKKKNRQTVSESWFKLGTYIILAASEFIDWIHENSFGLCFLIKYYIRKHLEINFTEEHRVNNFQCYLELWKTHCGNYGNLLSHFFGKNSWMQDPRYKHEYLDRYQSWVTVTEEEENGDKSDKHAMLK